MAADEDELEGKLKRAWDFLSGKRTEDHPEPTPSTYVPEQGATQPIDRPLSAPPPTLPLQPVPRRILP